MITANVKNDCWRLAAAPRQGRTVPGTMVTPTNARAHTDQIMVSDTPLDPRLGDRVERFGCDHVRAGCATSVCQS